MQKFVENAVFSALAKIPRGQVTTYKSLAQQVGIKNPRLIGTIIHKNTDPKNIRVTELYGLMEVLRTATHLEVLMSK